MKMNRWLVMMVAIIVLASSCTDNKDFKVTKSGLGYKIFPGGSKDSLKAGSLVRVRLVQKIEDSLLNIPDETPDQFLPTTPVEFDLMEIVHKIKVGDSVVYRIPVDTILAKNPGQQAPPFLKKGKNIYVYMKVLKGYDSSQAQSAMEDRQKEYARVQQVIEQKRQKEFDKIAKEKFGGALQTAGGTLVKITSPGEGPTCDSGKVISMMYEGRFTDGRVFDGNMKSTDSSQSKPPLEFQYGSMPVIRGWTEALLMLRKGSKASFLIPYQSGYGPSGYMGIPGFSNLLFDVEVIDLKDAPKGAKAGSPPQPTQH